MGLSGREQCDGAFPDLGASLVGIAVVEVYGDGSWVFASLPMDDESECGGGIVGAHGHRVAPEFVAVGMEVIVGGIEAGVGVGECGCCTVGIDDASGVGTGWQAGWDERLQTCGVHKESGEGVFSC